MKSELQRRREALGWSIADVASRVKRTTVTIRNWETGVHHLSYGDKCLLEAIFTDEEEKLKEEEKKMKERSSKPKIKVKAIIPNLIHLVEKNEKTYYLLKGENGLYMIDKYKIDNITYVPAPNMQYKLATPDILKEPMDIDFKNLFNEVVLFIKTYLEMPSDTDYTLLALWVFHTYIIEKSNTTPILYFYGMKETGKTRAGEVLGELAFRCERLRSPTEAFLFRAAHSLKTSLVIDEIKLWGIDGDQEVARLIKSRYKRGLAVGRINLLKNGDAQFEYYDVFAPLVICTTETIPDDIESRCFVFLMQKNFKVEVEKTISEKWGNKLRQKLIIFRANYFDQELKEIEQITRGRLNEISIPLYQILELLSFIRTSIFWRK